MIHSLYESKDYPILVDPDFNELMVLSEQKWDTVRICVEGDHIALASGFGNTHESVTKAMRIVLSNKRLLPETFILFKEGGDFWFNLEDVSGPRKAHYRQVCHEYFTDDHGELLLDLIRNS